MAAAASVSIMQWRRPDVDLTAIGDAGYRQLLSGSDVIVSGLEAFKRGILEWVRKPIMPPPPPPSQARSVFINADGTDLTVANEIQRECQRKLLMTALPMFGESAEAIRKDLAAN